MLELGIGQVAVEGWKRHTVQIQNFCAKKSNYINGRNAVKHSGFEKLLKFICVVRKITRKNKFNFGTATAVKSFAYSQDILW